VFRSASILSFSECDSSAEERGSNTILVEGCAEVLIFGPRYGNPGSSMFVEVACNFSVTLMERRVSIIEAEKLAILSGSYRARQTYVHGPEGDGIRRQGGHRMAIVVRRHCGGEMEREEGRGGCSGVGFSKTAW
jgi:hypothetical protein